MADDSHKFFQRLKKQGVNQNLATLIVSSKQFTNEELTDWAITDLVSINQHDAINIVKNLHFGRNVSGDKKSAILCSRINDFKKSSHQEAGQQGGHSKGQSNHRGGGCGRGGLSGRGGSARGGGPVRGGGPPRGGSARGGDRRGCSGPPPRSYSGPINTPTHCQPLLHPPPLMGCQPPPPRFRPPIQTHGGSSLRLNDGILPTPHERKRQQPIQTDNQYLNENLDRLKSLSENAQGIQGFSSPMVPSHYPDNDETTKTSGRGKRNRGKKQKQEGYGRGGDSGEDSDSSVQSRNSNMLGNRRMNQSYGSRDFLDEVGGRNTNKGRHSHPGNHGNGGDRNHGPRHGRGGGRGHHDNSAEMVNNNEDNQTERSQGHYRGQGRGRGRCRGRGRHGNQGRRWSSKRNVNSEGEDEESDSDSDSDESSVSGSEVSRSIISGSQDHLNERLKDFDTKRNRRRRHQKPRSSSVNEEVETFEDDRVDENQIFRYLVKSFAGFTVFDEFVDQCDLFPGDLDTQKWFRCHKRRFKLFEKEGKILYVAAFYRDVTLCLDYNCLFGREKVCSKTDCEHFHICKNFISGNCTFGETCRFSHSFRDASNVEHKKKLGLHGFSDKEMVIILANRYPKICSDFLRTTSCLRGENCPNLHICSLSLRGRCTKEADTCPLGHSFETDHNRWVLQALEYYSWLRGKSCRLLKKIILVDRSLEAPVGTEMSEREEPEISDQELKDISEEIEKLQKAPGKKKQRSRANRFKTEDPEDVISFNLNQVHISEMSSSVNVEDTEEPVSESAEKSEPKQSKKKTKTKTKAQQKKQDDKVEGPTTWENDAADNIPICVKYMEGSCSGVCPKGHHHPPAQSPYVWQIKQDGAWCSFKQEYSEEIEEGFCKHLEVIDAEILVDNQAVYMVHVCVSDIRDKKGVVYEQDGVMLSDPHTCPVRRLSTPSYVDVKDKKASPSFVTQWRWYWKDDQSQWVPFDTDNFQKTLERKYKYEQQTYLFTRENYRFKYRIDFRTFRQVNLDTMTTRDICRRPLFVSAEDVKHKVFPLCLEVADPINKPPGFVPWDLSNDFELVELERVKPEFKAIRERFFETLDSGRFDILYIYRVQNQHLYQDYEQRRKKMKKEIDLEGQGRDVNEKFLFHGTDCMKTCQGICTNNFDFRTSGKNATVYGEGSYFAETSKYSHSYTKPGKNNERYMFRAKVLVGLSAKGNSSYRRPPERPGQTHKLYDSCVDNEDKPNMYIIFERSQSYPEYLIAYREKSSADLEMAATGTSRTVAAPVRPATTGTSRTVAAPVRPAVTVIKPALAPKPTTSDVDYSIGAVKPTSPTAPIPAPRVSRAAPQPTARLQPIVYPSESKMEASAYPATSSHDPLSYPTATALDYNNDTKWSSSSQGNVEVAGKRSYGVYDQKLTDDQMNQYYIEDQLERKRRAEEYASNLAKWKESEKQYSTPQQKKKDDGCVLQ